MVKPKIQSKKQQKRGIDFKKIKRKVGRKLPPPKNATNTEIKSKAIILPEQSVASEKAGLAVSKKGLTLKELLQQTSHHNSKVRKDALIGIRDILHKHPAELKLHKLAVIEKLRERISDDDKLVRETLYQLLKSVVFPGSEEDNQELVVSLMMAYIFSAMTHLSIDVRLMAFKFVHLVLHHYPSSFSMYSEKILQNFEDLLRKNQFSLQDRSKLKNALAGLVRCLSLLPFNKGEDGSTLKNESHSQATLHAFEPDDPEDLIGLAGVIRKLLDLLPVILTCFQDLIQNTPTLDAQSFDCMLSILQSVDLVVKYFVHGIGKSDEKRQNPLPPHERPYLTVGNQMISHLTLKKLWDVFPLNTTHSLSVKDDDRYFILNATITEIFLQLSDWICFPPALLERFLGFIEISLAEKMCNGKQSSKAIHEKHILPLICFTPKLLMRVPGYWKPQILRAFTNVFRSCDPESSMKLACLSSIEEMIDPDYSLFSLAANDPEIQEYQINWIRDLPSLLILLGGTHPLSSKAVLRLQLKLGQCSQMNSLLSWEYDNMQHALKDFYSTDINETSVCYGPFISLPRDIQELSICCFYYFSFVDPLLLQSIVSCCLCVDLDPFVVFRILEVLHSAHIAGHVHISDYISFLVTLLSRFKIYPDEFFSVTRDSGKSNRGTFKAITNFVCSNLLKIGDRNVIFQMLEKVILDQMMVRPSVENCCAFLRVLVTLDSNPSRLSQGSIVNLSRVLPEYLICVFSNQPEDDDQTNHMKRCHYYYLPCFVLFYRSSELLKLVLDRMGSLVDEWSLSGSSHHFIFMTDVSTGPSAIVSIFLSVNEDRRMKQALTLCQPEMDNILQKMLALKSSEEINKKLEERHKIHNVCDKMRAVIHSSFSVMPET